MISFAIRCVKVYFRDRLAIFFSLLSVIIIFLLYALFLGSTWMTAVPEGVSGAQLLLDTWLMAGIMAVISFTTTTAAFGSMVDDKAKKIYKDFYSAPIKRPVLVGGYILSSYFIGVLMSLFALAFLDLYLLVRDGYILNFVTTIEAIGLILVSTLSNSAIVFFIASFIKSQTAFGTVSTLVGSLMGFIASIYMPIYLFPNAVQVLIKLFPISHAAALFRLVIMSDPVNTVFMGAPEEILVNFQKEMGVVFQLGDFTFTPFIQVLYLLATAVVFYLLSILVSYRKAK